MKQLKKTLLLSALWLTSAPLFAQYGWEEAAKSAKMAGAKDIDVQFYALKVELPLDKPFIKAETRIDFVAKEADTKVIWLAFSSKLKVLSITEAASFEQKENSLLITLKNSPAKDAKSTLTIQYEGTPPQETYKNSAEDNQVAPIGLVYHQHGADKQPLIATVGYPQSAHLWFPNNPQNADKADSLHIDITIEDRKAKFVSADGKENQIPFIAVANGVLENTLKGDKTKTFQWRHRYPIEPQHVGFAISNFAKTTVNFTNENREKFPLNFYVLPQEMEESKGMMDRCSEIMTCMTNTFGRYPYGKEGFSVVDIDLKLNATGVPAQGLVLLEDMKSFHMYRLVHNMSRMWFGCHIYPQTSQDQWITEAFAAYGEGIWQSYKRGLNVFQAILDQKEYFDEGTLYAAKTEYAAQIGYTKGMYVVHMLRGIMGENYFFEMLKAIPEQKRLKKGSINTKEFHQLCEYYASENVTQDYTYFFDQWVYGNGYPTFEVSFINPKKGTVEVTVKQSSSNGKLFAMPAKIEFVLDDNSKITQDIKLKPNASETFTFPVPKGVKEAILDPENWVFNEQTWTRQIINTKTPIENVKISTANFKRDVTVSFSSPKKQDVLIELILLADGVEIKENKTIATQNVAGIQGDFSKGFQIPLPLTNRGVYSLRIVGKSDIYSKELRLKQTESKFD